MRARIAELKVLLTADKKQATILAGLLVFLLISAARMLFQMSPSKASAKQRDAATADLDSGADAAREAARREEIVLAPLPDEARDIFALDPEKFPEPAPSEQSADVRPKSDPGIDEADGAGSLSEQELAEQRVLEEAGGLRLRSTILGASPIAVIETAGKGKTRSVVLTVGDAYEGFEVIEIRRHSVLIEKHGVRVELNRALPDT